MIEHRFDDWWRDENKWRDAVSKAAKEAARQGFFVGVSVVEDRIRREIAKLKTEQEQSSDVGVKMVKGAQVRALQAVLEE